MDFACPKCRAALLTDGNLKKCENGHSFDRARAGYYNLLLGSSGGVHGDNRDMVEARRRFLSADNYLPLARAIARTVSPPILPLPVSPSTTLFATAFRRLTNS